MFLRCQPQTSSFCKGLLSRCGQSPKTRRLGGLCFSLGSAADMEEELRWPPWLWRGLLSEGEAGQIEADVAYQHIVQPQSDLIFKLTY